MRSATRTFFLASFITVALAGLARANTPIPGAAAADLKVRATSVTFSVGLPGRYTLSVVNQGPNATNAPITLNAALGTGLSFQSISSGWTCSSAGLNLSCSNPDSLSASTTLAVSLLVNVDGSAVPSVTTVFTVSYDGDTNSGNNSTSRTNSVRGQRGPTFTPTRTGSPVPATATPSPGGPTLTPTRTLTPTTVKTATATRTPQLNKTDVSLGKTTFGPFSVGNNGTYTLTVTNLGGLATNGDLTVIDNLPTSLGFVSATGTDWSCSAAGQVVTCDRLTALDALSSSSITLVVSVGTNAFPTVTNSATLTYAADTDTTNNLARRPTTVRQRRLSTSATTHQTVHN